MTQTSVRSAVPTLIQKAQDLLKLIPEAQRPAASLLLIQYGPRLFEMALEDVWTYLRRLMAGDLNVVTELDAKLSDDAFIVKVKANAIAWEAVVAYNVTRDALRTEIILRTASVVASVLLAVVGL